MQVLNLGFPNGTSSLYSRLMLGGGTRRTEASKYPQEKKSIEIPRVRATESGTGQTELLLRGSQDVVFGPGLGLAL